MDDWKLTVFPVVRLNRPNETFVHFVNKISQQLLEVYCADCSYCARFVSLQLRNRASWSV